MSLGNKRELKCFHLRMQMKDASMKPKLHIIIASTRPGRVGPSIAQWFSEYTAEHGKFEPVLADLAEFNLPLFDEPEHPMKQNYHHAHTKAWAESVSVAD